MPVGARTDSDGAGTRGLEAGVTIAFGEPQDPEARTVALLWVRPVREDGFDEGGGLRADGAGPGDEARGGPLQVQLMRFGHVGRVGGVPAAEMAADMGRHPLPAMEELDRRHRQARIDELVAEGVGDGVVVSVELDVVVDIHAGVVVPLADDECLGREGPEGGAIQALEELPAAGAVEPHRAHVQDLEQLGDAGVERGEGEEPLVAQPGQDPPGDDEHPRLDLGFLIGCQLPPIPPIHRRFGSRTRFIPSGAGVPVRRRQAALGRGSGHLRAPRRGAALRAGPLDGSGVRPIPTSASPAGGPASG